MKVLKSISESIGILYVGKLKLKKIRKKNEGERGGVILTQEIRRKLGAYG